MTTGRTTPLTFYRSSLTQPQSSPSTYTIALRDGTQESLLSKRIENQHFP